MPAESTVLVREFVRAFRQMIIWLWPAVATVYAVVITAVASVGEIRSSYWLYVGTEAPKWILFGIGIMYVSVFLPQLVASGFTRRHLAVAAAAFTTGLAALWAALVLAGFGVERLVYAARGYLGGLADPYPVSSAGDAIGVFVEFALVGAAYACSGVLIGIAYYRGGPWRGSLLLPLALLPMVGVEFAFRSSWLGLGLQLAAGVERLPTLLSTVVALAVIGAGATVAYAAIRDVPVTTKGA